jgi:hypothetical protein
MDAKHILFLLELFEGKLSMEDILFMELPMLLNLEKEKADQIEKEAKRIRAAQEVAKNSSKPKGTVVNKAKKNR